MLMDDCYGGATAASQKFTAPCLKLGHQLTHTNLWTCGFHYWQYMIPSLLMTKSGSTT